MLRNQGFDPQRWVRGESFPGDDVRDLVRVSMGSKVHYFSLHLKNNIEVRNPVLWLSYIERRPLGRTESNPFLLTHVH